MDTIRSVHQHGLKALQIIDALWKKATNTVFAYHFYDRAYRNWLIKSNSEFIFI